MSETHEESIQLSFWQKNRFTIVGNSIFFAVLSIYFVYFSGYSVFRATSLSFLLLMFIGVISFIRYRGWKPKNKGEEW